MMNARKKPLIITALSVMSLGITTSCLNNGYDLNKDIDLNISVSGDVFTIPLGYSEETTLSKLIEETETLKLEDGIYSIRKEDKIDPVNINVEAVNINIDEPRFNGITVDFDANIDDFTISNQSSSSNLNAPKINVDVKLPGNIKLNATGPVVAQGLGTLSSTSNFKYKYPEAGKTWPKEVNTINRIILKDQGDGKGQKVSFTVAAPAGMVRIDDFTVTFPAGFILKDKTGTEKGNSIQLATGNTQNTATATYEFYVYGQKFTNANSTNGININDDIKFDFKYTAVKAPVSGDNITVSMEETDFLFGYANVNTNNIEAEMSKGTVDLSTTITGLDDIQEVRKITFKDESPNIKMDIAKNLQLPVDFKSGNLIIEFPSYYDLKLVSPTSGGITYSNNKLKIPATAMPDAKVEMKVNGADLTGKPIIEKNGKRVIELDGKVTYYLEGNQPIILQKDNISSKDVTDLDSKTLDVFVTGGKIQIKNAEVVADAYTAEVNDQTTFDVSVKVDEALRTLKTVEWKEGDKKPSITLLIKFPNFPADIDQLKFDGLKIQLPKFIKFAASAGVSKDNVLTLNDQFNVKESYKKVLETTGMDFSYMNGGNGLSTKESSEEGKRLLEITDPNETKINITGNVKTLAGAILNTNNLKDIKVEPTATIDVMPVGKVTGTVSPVIDPVNEEVDLNLGDDLDFLKDEGNELDIHNPQITLTLKNTVGVPVDLELNMYGSDANGQVIEGSKVGPVKFQLQPTAKDQDSKTSVFLISRQEMAVSQETADTYYKNIVVADLQKLMLRVPDKVKFEMTAKTNNGTEHHVDLSKDLTITGDYNVVVPLQFEDININYKEEIDDLQNDLSDVLEKTTSAELEIHADILNKIPLQLVLSAKAMDIDSNELTTIKTTVYANNKEGGIIAGTLEEGTAATTSVKIRLAATSNTDLKKLDKIELNIHATANETTAGLPLKGDQSLQITNAKVKIKKINLDLN